MYFSCRDRVSRATRLGCRRSRIQIKVKSTGDLKILGILSGKWYLFFESGTVMAAKGGGGLYFSHVVPKKQWASQPPLTLRLVGYRKSLSFMLLCMIWRQ